MNKYSGFIVGKNNGAFIKKLFGLLFLNVFAEETIEEDNNEGDGEEGNNSVINYEDLILKARKEEKDKMYKKLDKYKKEQEMLIKQHNEDLLKIGNLESLLSSSSSDDIKGLKDTIDNLKKENEGYSSIIEDYKQQLANKENEVKEKLEKEYEIKMYLNSKLMEYKDIILVPELVSGSTKEEIDASIEKAKERSEEIRKSLGIKNNTMNNTYRTSINPTNPSIGTIQSKQVDLNSLASMDVSSKEYKELRKQLGFK